MTRRPSATAWATATALALAFIGACAGARPSPSERSPVATTRAFYAALHDLDAPAAARLVAPPQGDAAVAALVRIARAYRDLEREVAERFGVDGARALGYTERLAAEREALDDAQELVLGERARVTSGEATLARLRRVEGAWRIELRGLETPRGLAELEREAEVTRRAADRVAAGVRQGLFSAPADVVEAFRDELDPAAPPRDRPRTPEAPEWTL